MPATRKVLTWNNFNFSTNKSVAGLGVWHDLLKFTVKERLIRSFFAGQGYQLKVPTMDQDTGKDIDADDEYTLSLTNSIADITGQNTDYQVEAFIDGSPATINSIDTDANEVTIDISGSSSNDSDLSVFYIPDDADQEFRFVVRATTNEFNDFEYDDLGAVHSLDQKDTNQRQVLNNGQEAPEFFEVVVQVKSDITYITDQAQNSDLNDNGATSTIHALFLPGKVMDLAEYIKAKDTPGTRAGVKERVIRQLTH